MWEPQPPGTLRAFQACNGIALRFILLSLVSTSRISGAFSPHHSLPSRRGQKENYLCSNFITYNSWPGAKGGMRCVESRSSYELITTGRDVPL